MTKETAQPGCGTKAQPSEEIMAALCEGAEERLNGYVDKWLRHPQFRAALGLPPTEPGELRTTSNTDAAQENLLRGSKRID